MNCFHFVSLKYWTQLTFPLATTENCCELLSFCIFEILNTAGVKKRNTFQLLWIAFILYLWNIEHSNSKQVIISAPLWIAFILYLWNIEHSARCWMQSTRSVVNCFHFVSLKYWTQQKPAKKPLNLVVNCFHFVSLKYWTQRYKVFNESRPVVNCFHFVSLKYWTQPTLY